MILAPEDLTGFHYGDCEVTYIPQGLALVQPIATSSDPYPDSPQVGREPTVTAYPWEGGRIRRPSTLFFGVVPIPYVLNPAALLFVRFLLSFVQRLIFYEDYIV